MIRPPVVLGGWAVLLVPAVHFPQSFCPSASSYQRINNVPASAGVEGGLPGAVHPIALDAVVPTRVGIKLDAVR